MGLFDRFRMPSEASGSTPPVRATSPVPDVNDFSAPFEDWIRDHLARLTDAAESDIDALSAVEFDEALTTRLAGAARLAETGLGFDYARPFADGVVEVLSLDLPDAVVTLPDERVAALGRQVPSLMALGLVNLRRLLVQTPVDVVRLRAGVSACLLVHGDSPYIASFASLLDDAVPRWVEGADLSNGVVFAVPHRHAIVLQTCSTAAQTRSALELVPWHAAQLFGEGVGPVSPHAYHWLDGRVTTLTRSSRAGGLRTVPSPFLASLLDSHRRAG
jgi:hypothetical protein